MNNLRLLLLMISVLMSGATQAQQAGKDVYADPQNLEVLPEDISSGELGDTMKGFALGLGARCETCHVGEANTPLDTFDFASDEKAMKRKARVMIRMTRKINESFVPMLDEIEDSPRVEVRCVTCHRGRQQPKLIQDVLDEGLDEDGLEATLARYAELRESYYGSHSFDFSEFTLPMYAQGLADRKMVDEAIAMVELNAGHFPQSYYTYFVLAELYKLSGNAGQAIENYNRAIELNPRAKGFLEAKIAELQGEIE